MSSARRLLILDLADFRHSYPEALKTHQHRTKAWLPEPIARALKTSPELVQRAAEGFYVRDPAQLRVSHSNMVKALVLIMMDIGCIQNDAFPALA